VARYDLAVIGADLGVLATAALLSAKGGKAAVFAAGKNLAASIGGLEKDGFSFAPGPSLLAAHGRGMLIEKLFSDAQAGVLTAKPAEVYQVALPDRRISIWRNRESTLQELRREFPENARAIEQFYLDLDRTVEKTGKSRLSAFFAKRKTAAAFLKPYSFSRELYSLLSILSNYFYRQPLEMLPLTDLTDLILHTPVRTYGLRTVVAQQLIDRIVRSGGEIRYGEEAAEIAIAGHRLIGVNSSQDKVGSRTVLLAAREPRQSILFTGIRETVIPVGMEKDVIFLPDYSKPDEFMSLSLSDERDESAAPPGMRAMTCVFNSLSASSTREEMVSRISRLIPFLEDFIVLSEMKPVRDAARASTDVRYKPIHAGSGEPVLFHANAKGMYKLVEDALTPIPQMKAAYKLIKKIG
jgi:hypothetical protein